MGLPAFVWMDDNVPAQANFLFSFIVKYIWDGPMFHAEEFLCKRMFLADSKQTSSFVTGPLGYELP
tara:strand:- start:113 stop:310 length:198 start_codon:yes stop_codon:yes gene_type:complete